MKCSNCGGLQVVWHPDRDCLWCIDCNSEPRGMEIPPWEDTEPMI